MIGCKLSIMTINAFIYKLKTKTYVYKKII